MGEIKITQGLLGPEPMVVGLRLKWRGNAKGIAATIRPTYNRFIPVAALLSVAIQGQTVKIPPHSILLRGSRRPLPCRQTTRIFSSEICRLDELEHTLVLGASAVLCWKHRCINGRVDISVSLSLHGAVQRSEMRAFFANGVDKMYIPWDC